MTRSLYRAVALILYHILAVVVRYCPRRDIVRMDGYPYLVRWYLFGDPDSLRYFPVGHQKPRWWQRPLVWLPLVYVHRFVGSDEPMLFHTHPWDRATSFILRGRYMEQIHRGNAWTQHTREAGDVNRFDATTAHRVGLLTRVNRRGHVEAKECWTLFFPGKRVADWGFIDAAKGGRFIPWREWMRKHDRAGDE